MKKILLSLMTPVTQSSYLADAILAIPRILCGYFLAVNFGGSKFGVPWSPNGVELSFHPAGHVPGSGPRTGMTSRSRSPARAPPSLERQGDPLRQDHHDRLARGTVGHVLGSGVPRRPGRSEPADNRPRGGGTNDRGDDGCPGV